MEEAVLRPNPIFCVAPSYPSPWNRLTLNRWSSEKKNVKKKMKFDLKNSIPTDDVVVYVNVVCSGHAHTELHISSR